MSRNINCMGWRSWRKDTRRHVGVRLCFRDVSFLRGSFRREKVHPSARVTHLTVLPVFAMCVWEANTHANDGTFEAYLSWFWFCVRWPVVSFTSRLLTSKSTKGSLRMYIPRRFHDMLVTRNTCLQGGAPAHINLPINVRTRICRVKMCSGTPLYRHPLNTGTLI